MSALRKDRLKTKRQAKSEERRARQAQIEREAATRREALAEEQAPRAQRVSVQASDGTVLRAPIAEPDLRRGGFRRPDPLRKMHEANSSLVTGMHLKAATRFSYDYEVGVLGASPTGMAAEWIDGGSGVGISDRQIEAAESYRAACDAVGRSLRTPVQWVVLHRWSIGEVGAAMGISEQRASGYLMAGLDRLADHYVPDRELRIAAVETRLTVDASVTDIPQSRLGRFPRE